MTIKEMHYDFKKKLNKIDSQQYKNFLIPEIDWVLNEAQELFIKIIAKPRKKSHLGFELTQRTIDDIRTLVINKCFNTSKEDPPNLKEDIIDLPDDYWHYVKGSVNMTKANCENIKAVFHIKQHDDEFETSLFNKSSFEWRTINGVFFDNKIKLYNDGTFLNNELCITYIKKPKYIHNAVSFNPAGYRLPGKIENLTGTVDSELPEHTHREIVDIAVLITTGEIQLPDYQTKMQKLNLNGLL